MLFLGNGGRGDSLYSMNLFVSHPYLFINSLFIDFLFIGFYLNLCTSLSGVVVKLVPAERCS